MEKDEVRRKQVETLITLWSGENAVKTNKLMAFLAVNSILATALLLADDMGWLSALFGVLFSVFWFFCIGRTVAYQQIWKKKYCELLTDAEKKVYLASDEEKSNLPMYGRMSGKYILLGPTVIIFIIWCAILAYMIPWS